jgi:hypothetical protein
LILPYLETNRYRPRVLAIKKADIQIRRPLLGRALQTKSVRNDFNIMWMFLSGNADVVLQSNNEGDDEQDDVLTAASDTTVEVAAIAPVEVEASRKRQR